MMLQIGSKHINMDAVTLIEKNDDGTVTIFFGAGHARILNREESQSFMFKLENNGRINRTLKDGA